MCSIKLLHTFIQNFWNNFQNWRVFNMLQLFSSPVRISFLSYSLGRTLWGVITLFDQPPSILELSASTSTQNEIHNQLFDILCHGAFLCARFPWLQNLAAPMDKVVFFYIYAKQWIYTQRNSRSLKITQLTQFNCLEHRMDWMLVSSVLLYRK